MCFQDDAPDTKKHFTRDPVQEKLLPGECCSSFHLRSSSSLFFFFSTNRDACWCALDSLRSCDLISKDISGKRRPSQEESHITCTCTNCKIWQHVLLFVHTLYFCPRVMGWDTSRTELSGRSGGCGGGGGVFWQQLQRRWDTLGSGRLGLACLCPGLWWLFTGT